MDPYAGRRIFGKQNERSAKCLCSRLLQKVVTPFGKAEDGRQSRSKKMKVVIIKDSESLGQGIVVSKFI